MEVEIYIPKRTQRMTVITHMEFSNTIQEI